MEFEFESMKLSIKHQNVFMIENSIINGIYLLNYEITINHSMQTSNPSTKFPYLEIIKCM